MLVLKQKEYTITEKLGDLKIMKIYESEVKNINAQNVLNSMKFLFKDEDGKKRADFFGTLIEECPK